MYAIEISIDKSKNMANTTRSSKSEIQMKGVQLEKVLQVPEWIFVSGSWQQQWLWPG